MNRIIIKVGSERTWRGYGANVAKSRLLFTLAMMLLLAATEASSAMSQCSENKLGGVDLLETQVFARHSIQATQSDYQGTTVAGGDVDLSDFEINGNLVSGNKILFQRGRVMGFLISPDTRSTSVFSNGSGSIKRDAIALASSQLDLLGARLSALRQTSRFEIESDDVGNKELTASVRRDIEVVDLDGDLLTVAGYRKARFVLSGDQNGLMLIRIHGRSVHLKRIEFSVKGGMDPSQIVFFFPEAFDLEISESGSGGTGVGSTWNIPGSIIAPNASLRFSASTVTGQVFTDSITSVRGLPSGQVDKFPVVGPNQTAGGQTVFVPSRLLKTALDDRFFSRFMAYNEGLQVVRSAPVECFMR